MQKSYAHEQEAPTMLGQNPILLQGTFVSNHDKGVTDIEGLLANRALYADQQEEETFDTLELVPGQETLSAKVSALLESGRFEDAYTLIMSKLETLSSETNPEAWMDMLLLADEVSDILYANGHEHLSIQMDYLTARPGSINPNNPFQQTATNMSMADTMSLTLERNNMTPSTGLFQVINDLYADLMGAHNRTLSWEALDPDGITERPDFSFINNNLKEIDIATTTKPETPDNDFADVWQGKPDAAPMHKPAGPLFFG